MREAQHLYSSKPARLGHAALSVLVVLGAAAASASAAEPAPSPELPSQTPASNAATPQGPQPEAPPQAKQAEAPPQATQPSRSRPEAAPVAPAAPAPAEEAPQPAAPIAGAPITMPHSNAHRLRRRPARSSHAVQGRSSLHPRATSSAAVAGTLAALPTRRDDTLLWAAVAALGAVSLAGLTLQRLLLALSRLSHGGPAT